MRVRKPDGAPASGAAVRLLGAREPICSDASLLVATTDASGVARLQTEWCGPARLIAMANGSRRADAVLDTCEQHAMDLRLRELPVDEAGDDEAAATALQFVQALVRGDRAAVRALLADPSAADNLSSAEIERASSVSWGRVPPSAVRVVSAAREHDGGARVELELFYDDGCERRVGVELAHGADGWRVTAFELAVGS